MKFIRSWLRAVALFSFLVFSPMSVSAANLCNTGTEIFIGAYHSSIVATKDNFFAFGEAIAADGVNHNLSPVDLTPANGYTFVGDILFATDATHDTQAFILSTGGLYVWGASGANGGTQELAISTAVDFHEIDMPVGIATSDVTYLTATNGGVFLVANGKVYSQGVLSDLMGNNGTVADANGWYTVQKSTGGDLINVELFKANYDGAFAVTSTNEYYTWGSVVSLGDTSVGQTLTAATLMTAPFSDSPSMIAVTGYDDDRGLSYYVLNPVDTKVYVLGGNGYGQLGIGTTVNTDTWSVVQHIDGGDLTGIIDINADDNSDHYPTAGVIVNNYVDGGNTYNDVFLVWGRNSMSALGTGGDKSLPTVPNGFILGSSIATKIEMGGHTTMYYDPNFDDGTHVGKMCYIGHKVNGSMGDGSSANTTVDSFDCINTPYLATMCAAEKPPVATNDDKVDQPADSTVTLNVVTDDNGHGIDSDPDGTVDAATVDLDPSTDAIDATLTVVGEGVWSVDASGLVTFAPDAVLVGDPTDIEYTVQDNNENESNTAMIHITYIRKISITDVTAVETNSGTTNFDFVVSIDAALATDVTVAYTTVDGTGVAGDDYTAVSGTATITAGQTTTTVSVPVAGDTTVEGDDTFTVELSSPVGATITDGSGLGTIQNDDSTTLSISDVSQNELHAGSSNFDFTITLTEPSATDVTVAYTTVDGTGVAGDDYTAVSGTATITAGQTTTTVSVPVAGDTTVEGDDTFTVELSSPVGATITDGSGLGTIQNDDSTTLSISDVSQNELHAGSSNFDFTITLTEPSATDVTVAYTTVDGTGVAGDDYTAVSGTATITAGQTTTTVSVPVAGDTTVEGDDTFTVELSSPVGATITDGSGLGTIQNDDATTVMISDVTAVEGDDLIFDVNLSNPSSEDIIVEITTVDGSATNPDDYTSITTTVTISADQTGVTVTVPSTDDVIGEPTETFTVNGNVTSGNTINTDPSGTGTITDDAPAPDISIVKTAAVGGTGVEGDTITYSFEVTNTGNLPLTNIDVDDARIGVADLPVADLDVGASATVTADYVVTAQDIIDGNITNQATATGTDTNGDPVTDVSDDDSRTEDDPTVTTLTQTGVIAGTVYEDTNGDGVQDPGEPGISNVTVTITDANGVEQNLTTESNGNYAANVPVGDTIIDIDESTLPASVTTQTQGTDTTTVVVPLGGIASDVDGYEPDTTVGTVDGVVYEDTNGNGAQDIGEAGIEGVTVTIADVNGAEQNVTTDVNGVYSATVPAGDTIINIDESTLPGGSTQTEGTNQTTVTVPVGGSASDIDGYEPAADAGEVTGVVYEDTNGNGIQDAGEPGIQGVTVNITDSTGNIQTVVTDLNGAYSTTVPAGDTIIDIDESTLPGGSTRTEGTDPTTVTVPAAGIATDTDGYKPAATSGTIAGIVYEDTNGNGTQDADEPGIQGVDVTITDSDGRIQTLVTDVNGTYSATVPSGDTLVDIEQSDIDSEFVHTEGTDPTTVVVPVGGIGYDVDGFTPKQLILTMNAFCENDVPYIDYDIQLIGLDPVGQTATLTWTSADGVQSETISGLDLNNTHQLWAGAAIDSSGNGTVWPGWIENSDGTWSEVMSDWRRWNPDGSDANVTVTFSVNPENSVTVLYPPATSVCSANPTQPGSPVAKDDSETGISGTPTVVNMLDNDENGSSPLDPTSVKIIDPAGNPVIELVVPGEGKWTVDPVTGAIIFTPEAGFTADPTPITYTVQDDKGLLTNEATVTIDYPSVPTNDSRTATRGNSVIVDVLSNDDPVDPTTVKIIDPITHDPVVTLVVPGEGIWTVDPVTGEITFVPEAGFTGDPTPILYFAKDSNGNLVDVARVIIDYEQELNDDFKTGIPGEPTTLDIIGNDDKIDESSVSFVIPDNATGEDTDGDGDIDIVTVDGEGVWSVDENGTLTFTPEDGFIDSPTPIKYSATDRNGNIVAPATVIITYPARLVSIAVPTAVDDPTISITDYGPTIINVLANDTFGSDDNFGEANIPNEIIIITQPTHGTVSLDDGGTPNDPTDDVFIYTPEANIAHVQDSFEYTITDSNGDTSTATVLLDVNCASTQRSDSGSALGMVSMLMMMFLTGMVGLYYVRREDERGEA